MAWQGGLYDRFQDGEILPDTCVNMGDGTIRHYTQNDGKYPAEWVDYRIEE